MRLSVSLVFFLLLASPALSQPLIDAVKAHDLQRVKAVLSAPVDIDQVGPDGTTPLLLAARTGDFPVCKELLDHGANPNVKGDATLTPLMEASARGFYNIVESLLKKRADANLCARIAEGPGGEPLSNPALPLSGPPLKIDGVEKSPLILAAEGEHMAVARLLLDHGADVNKQAEWFVTSSDAHYAIKGRTALMCAAQKRFPALVKLLLEKKADVTLQERAVVAPGMYRNSGLAGDLDLSGRPLFVKHSTALHLAAEACNRTIAGLLLEAGADIESRDGRNSTPLSAAVRNGCTPVVEMLVEKGADVNAEKDTPNSPLILAAERGKSHLVDLLIKAGASITQRAGEQGSPLLSWAVVGGNRQVVRTLLDQGADVNATDKNKTTPLMTAAEEGEAIIVRFLIDRKAKLDLKNADGQTALMLASKKGRAECVKALLMGGADGTVRDNGGKTALARALEEGDLRIVKLLREGGPATARLQSVENDRLSDLIEYFSTKINERDYSAFQYLAFSKPYGKWDVRPLHLASLPHPEGNDNIGPAEVPEFVWGVVAHHDYGLPLRTVQNVRNEFVQEGFAHKQRYCKNFYPSRRAAFLALCQQAELNSRSIYVQQRELTNGEAYERVDNIYRQNRRYWRYRVPRESPFQISPLVDTLEGYQYSSSDESILQGLYGAGCYCMVKVNGYIVFMTGGVLGNSIGFIHGKARPRPGSLGPLFNLALVEDLGEGFYYYVSR